MGREELLIELTKYKKLKAELKEMVECPVCLMTPREGPMACCPRGHLICSPCLRGIQGDLVRAQLDPGVSITVGLVEAREVVECPTCRDPMGKGKSMLSKRVIEKLEHECSRAGCGLRMPHQALEQHESECEFRLVLCPGSNKSCKLFLPYREVDYHAITCPDISRVVANNGKLVQLFNLLESDRLNKRRAAWKTQCFKVDENLFFLRINRDNNDLFYMDMVMK